MWIALSKKDTCTERERYFEDELDSLREQQEREYERNERDRKRREKERHEEREWGLRHPSDWLEALNNQRVLCLREVGEGEEDDDFIGSSCNAFFQNTADACDKAMELWREVEASKQSEIEELEKRIATIRDGIRLEVADKLQAADERQGFSQVTQQMHDDSIDGFCDW